MEKASQLLRRNLIVFITMFVIVIGDILTKNWIRNYPSDGGTIFRLGFIRITHIQNSGAAWGTFQGYSIVLMCIAVIGLIALTWAAIYVKKHYPRFVTVPNKIALGLIIGGDLGNLIDRFRFGGKVTDFIDTGIIPVFNVADSAITVGAILLAYALLRENFHENK